MTLEDQLLTLVKDFKKEVDGEEFMPSTVILIMEGYDGEGTPTLSVAHTSSMPWTILGLLEHQLLVFREQAKRQND